MNQEQLMVKEFHQKFGFTINDTPTQIDMSLGSVRHTHTLKEMDELLSAIATENLVEIADALGDVLYFIYGTGVAYGVDLEPVFAEIHRSNMTKERPDPTQYIDAKAVKGKDYSPPDIESIISDGLRSNTSEEKVIKDA